jgi:hypothetical protein
MAYILIIIKENDAEIHIIYCQEKHPGYAYVKLTSLAPVAMM